MSERGNFSGRLGFILAAAGSAVGLGNIWRFPYLAGQNGGAVFLLFYLACVFLLCYPVLTGEIAIGRAAATNAYGAYEKFGGKRWAMLGMFGIVIGVIILSYYNVVAGWAFGYFVDISFGSLLDQPNFKTFFGAFSQDVNMNLVFTGCFTLATALIVTGGVQHGIEIANKVMMPALFIILIGLIVYCLTLPNAFEGVKFYLLPDFSKMQAQTVFDGLRQAFFSLSLGMGGMMTYGSYLKKQENIVSSAAVIIIADTTVAFLAGLVVFPLIFAKGMSPSQGAPLVFFVLPEIFKDLGPALGRVVGGSFFLLLCFAALTSTISLLEVPVAYLVDQRKWSRKKAVWTVVVIAFVLGIPALVSQGAVPSLNQLPFYRNRDFLSFVSDMCDISLTIGGCLMCIFIARRWKIENFDRELENGNDKYSVSWLRNFYGVTIRYVCPILLGILSILIAIDKFWGLFE